MIARTTGAVDRWVDEREIPPDSRLQGERLNLACLKGRHSLQKRVDEGSPGGQGSFKTLRACPPASGKASDAQRMLACSGTLRNPETQKKKKKLP